MRYLNSIYDLLFESVESYSWEFVSDDNSFVKYTFDDIMGNKYLVEFKNIPRLRAGKDHLGTEYELCYFVYDEARQYYNVSKLVNVNPYRTLQTVLGDVLKDFTERKSWVKKISMFGLAKDSEKHYVTQRTKMYVRYLEMNPLPGYKMENNSNRIDLVKI